VKDEHYRKYPDWKWGRSGKMSSSGNSRKSESEPLGAAEEVAGETAELCGRVVENSSGSAADVRCHVSYLWCHAGHCYGHSVKSFIRLTRKLY